LLCGIVACNHPVQRTVTPAFYFWKQTWTGNSTEQQYIQQLAAKKLYIKFFDVTTDEVTKVPVPVAVFRQGAPLPANVDIVPVIFLMNEVWTRPDTALAANVVKLLEQLCDSIPAARIPEIQLDCDWTESSRDAYFSFIKQVKQSSFFRQRRLSATIRLYQVKYVGKTGVPPVDRGLLMCYNMGDLRKPGAHNSILDLEVMESYLGEHRIARYPLPLDIALPLFGWSVLFRNDIGYAGILRNVGETELKEIKLFTPGPHRLYTVQQDTLLNGYPLKKGNVIRRETVDPLTLNAAAKLVAKQLQTKDPAVIFYHLDSLTLQNYPLDELQKIILFFN